LAKLGYKKKPKKKSFEKIFFSLFRISFHSCLINDVQYFFCPTKNPISAKSLTGNDGNKKVIFLNTNEYLNASL